MATDREYIDSLLDKLTRDKSHLLHQAFSAPAGCRNFKTVVIRELDGDDEYLAAHRAGERTKKLKEVTIGVMMKAERDEQLRISIAAVDGVPTPDTIGGFVAFDKWTQRDKTAINRFFGKLNGLDTDDLEKSVADSVDVDPKRLSETTILTKA
jgi:hypothetical protein